MVTVYDLEGNAHEMAGVDARECCAEMGWTMTPGTFDLADTIEDKFHGMTNAELKGWLDKNGREYPALAKKADLLALCRA